MGLNSFPFCRRYWPFWPIAHNRNQSLTLRSIKQFRSTEPLFFMLLLVGHSLVFKPLVCYLRFNPPLASSFSDHDNFENLDALGLIRGRRRFSLRKEHRKIAGDPPPIRDTASGT